MTAKPTVYFDLDGTLYDLYGIEGWLERITTLADPTAYADEDALLVDMVELHKVLTDLIIAGYGIGIVTWLADGSTPEYAAAVRRVKREWIKKFVPFAQEVHIVKYGTPKHRIINDKADAIIVDDNPEVLNAWTHGQAIDATENLIAALRGLLNNG